MGHTILRTGSSNSRANMTFFYTTCFGLATLFHLYASIGSWFGLAGAGNWKVNGKAGDGTSPMEKMLDTILAVWYMGTLIGFLYANSLDNSLAFQVSLVPLIFYHLSLAVIFGLTNIGASMDVCNPEVLPPTTVAVIHGPVSAMCIVLYLGA